MDADTLYISTFSERGTFSRGECFSSILPKQQDGCVHINGAARSANGKSVGTTPKTKLGVSNINIFKAANNCFKLTVIDLSLICLTFQGPMREQLAWLKRSFSLFAFQSFGSQKRFRPV